VDLETERTTDRHCSRQDILIKDKIKAIDKQMGRNAVIGAMVRVALVGYTNVGKSTLMNAIGKSDVFVENKLLRLWTPFEKW
jgi:GTP-binding protein HflX